MNKIVLLILGLVSLTTFIKIVAQPITEHIGCHHASLAGATREPSMDELILMENSNRRSDSIDILNYDIQLDVSDYAGKKIEGYTEISFRTKLDQIKSITLDLRKLTIDSIIYQGKPITYSYDTEIIIANFGETLSKNTDRKIRIYYRGSPTKDPVWGGFYFDANYIYNLGIGLSSTPPNFGKVWFPCFDNFVERTTYDYTITTNPSMKAYCVGTFISEDILSNGKIKRHYAMLDQIPTYLSNIAASNYVVNTYNHASKYRNIPVQYIARSTDMAKMISQFSNMPKAIDALEFWFGPYRFERVGYVATTVGAMEHPTNTAFPISSITQSAMSSVELTMAHELGHHWWGDLTTLDDARDMWIKEGTAEYSSHLFHEYTYGRDVFLNTVRSNLSGIIKTAHRNDGAFLPLSPMPYNSTYGTHTYRKGAAMIHNMRAYLGDSSFRKTSMMIFDSLTGKSMNAYEFRDFLNRNSGRDMTDYFNDFIFNPGYIGFYVDSFHLTVPGELNVHVHQKTYQANHLANGVPVIISIYDEDRNRIEQKVIVTSENNTFVIRVPLNFKPKIILINENQELNLATVQNHSTINKVGSMSIANTDISSLNMSSIVDSVFLNLAHHYMAPSGSNNKANNIAKISDSHFWEISALTKSPFSFNGIIEYNGTDQWALDVNLIPAKEDSVILAYRPDWKSPWIEYPYYGKIIGGTSDKKGLFRISNFLPGQYAVAYGMHLNVANQDHDAIDLNIYPNPSSNILHINSDILSGNYIYQIIDMFGKTCLNGSVNSNDQIISLDKLPGGIYELLILSNKGQIVMQKSFEKI